MKYNEKMNKYLDLDKELKTEKNEGEGNTSCN